MSEIVSKYTQDLKSLRRVLTASIRGNTLKMDGQMLEDLVDLGIEHQNQLITYSVLLRSTMGKDNSFKFLADFCKDLLIEVDSLQNLNAATGCVEVNSGR